MNQLTSEMLMEHHFQARCVVCGALVALPKQRVEFSSSFNCKVDLSEVMWLYLAVFCGPM